MQPPTAATTQFALLVAQLLDERQAEDVVALDVSGPFVIADYFVVATVKNTRHAQALAREVDLSLKQQHGRRRRNQGGMETENSNWVLLDYDDVVVHLFLAEARQYYALEDLWGDAPRVPFTRVPPEQRKELVRPETTSVHLLRPTQTKLSLYPSPDPTIEPTAEDAPVDPEKPV